MGLGLSFAVDGTSGGGAMAWASLVAIVERARLLAVRGRVISSVLAARISPETTGATIIPRKIHPLRQPQ